MPGPFISIIHMSSFNPHKSSKGPHLQTRQHWWLVRDHTAGRETQSYPRRSDSRAHHLNHSTKLHILLYKYVIF